MNNHSLLSHAKGAHLFAGKLFLIAAVVLSATVWTQAQSPVDLSIRSYSSVPVTLGDGQDVMIYIDVYIESKRQASGVVVTADLPSGVTFSSAVSREGECSFADNRVTCNLGVVGREGQRATDYVASIQVNVKPTQAGKVALTVRLTANEPDPNLSNNTVITNPAGTVNSPPKSRNKRVRFF